MDLDNLARILRENFDRIMSEKGTFREKIERLIEFCNNYYTYNLSCKDISFLESLRRKEGVCKHWGDLFRLGLWYILTKLGGRRVDGDIDLRKMEIEMGPGLSIFVENTFLKKIIIRGIVYDKHDYTLICGFDRLGIGCSPYLVSAMYSNWIPGKIVEDTGKITKKGRENYVVDLGKLSEEYQIFLRKLGLIDRVIREYII